MISNLACKIELEHDVKEGEEVFCRRRRIANFGNDRSDFE
jgi:hypothetical protein